MQILNAPQLSMGWVQAHCGVVTASYMSNVLNFTKERVLKNGEKRGGLPGSKRRTYLWQKVAERVSGIALQDNYVSKEMLDGIEREPLARAAYELENDCMVEEIGFALHDDIPRFGCSPDGVVGKDGGIELKCPKLSTHLRWIYEGIIPEQHLPQIDTCIAVTDRAWWDFQTYHPHAPEEARQMTIRRERDEPTIVAIKQRVVEFNAEVDAIIERIMQITGPFKLPAASLEKDVIEQYQGYDAMLTDDDIRAVDPSWMGV